MADDASVEGQPPSVECAPSEEKKRMADDASAIEPPSVNAPPREPPSLEAPPPELPAATEPSEPPAKATKTEEPLPSGWSAHVDPVTGTTYYWNAALGATSWERPTPSEATSAPIVDQTSSAEAYSRSILGDPARAGNDSKWVKHSDPESGVPYFFNSVTNETQWEVPPEGFIDATVFGTTASTHDRRGEVRQQPWRETTCPARNTLPAPPSTPTRASSASPTDPPTGNLLADPTIATGAWSVRPPCRRRPNPADVSLLRPFHSREESTRGRGEEEKGPSPVFDLSRLISSHS